MHNISFVRTPLHKWFWALDWVGSDKGGISALGLSQR
jgi:hypothetical protein